MKMIHCANILLGEIGDMDMSYDRLILWQKERMHAFESLLTKAAEQRVEIVLITGGLFADNFVPETIFDQCMQLIQKYSLDLVFIPNKNEISLFSGKDELPENLYLISPEFGRKAFCKSFLHIVLPSESGCTDDAYVIIVSPQADDGGHNANQLPFSLHDKKGDWFICNGRPAKQFEPVGKEYRTMSVASLENAEFSDDPSGYWLWNIAGPKTAEREWKPQAQFDFYTQPVDISEISDFQSICRKVLQETVQCNKKSFVRVVLTGSVPVGVYINPSAIRNAVADRFFYTEVYNDTQLDTADGFESDISLQGTFVRQVLVNETLSENEKARIIRCGWNALNGKELFE